MISSQALAIDRWWAIKMIVLSCNLIKYSKISFSNKVSRPLVASSKIIISESFKIALAIAKRYFCPPDRLFPPSSRTESNLKGCWLIKSTRQAALHASKIFSNSG